MQTSLTNCAILSFAHKCEHQPLCLLATEEAGLRSADLRTASLLTHFSPVPRAHSLGHVVRPLPSRSEYYFSERNLQHDFFLRKHMNPEGWVDLSVVARFNRVRAICSDIAAIASALEASVHVECIGPIGEAHSYWLRCAVDPGRWIPADTSPMPVLSRASTRATLESRSSSVGPGSVASDLDALEEDESRSIGTPSTLSVSSTVLDETRLRSPAKFAPSPTRRSACASSVAGTALSLLPPSVEGMQLSEEDAEGVGTAECGSWGARLTSDSSARSSFSDTIAAAADDVVWRCARADMGSSAGVSGQSGQGHLPSADASSASSAAASSTDANPPTATPTREKVEVADVVATGRGGMEGASVQFPQEAAVVTSSAAGASKRQACAAVLAGSAERAAGAAAPTAAREPTEAELDMAPCCAEGEEPLASGSPDAPSPTASELWLLKQTAALDGQRRPAALIPNVRAECRTPALCTAMRPWIAQCVHPLHSFPFTACPQVVDSLSKATVVAAWSLVAAFAVGLGVFAAPKASIRSQGCDVAPLLDGAEAVLSRCAIR